MWFLKATTLCLLSVGTLLALGYASGLTIKGLWSLLCNGAMREFLSEEGRHCLFIGGLFAVVLLLTIYTPDILSFIARMIDPQHFDKPAHTPAIPVWLIFSYCIVNILMLGVLYYRKQP